MSTPDPGLAGAVNAARLATLGMLVAGVAHELNTPLGAIHSNHDVLNRALARLSDILADEQVDETELDEVRRVLRAVREVLRVNDLAVERMVGIVASLRTFGRVDGAEMERADLHEGLDSTLLLLRHELRDGVEVIREYGDLPRVHCRPTQLNQLFMNLLLNAAQAIQGDGTITIRTRLARERVEVEVEDTGVGISRAAREHIFEPGFTTRGGRVGMGLGLSICRQIVDDHGGEIEVRSEPGRGSTFLVSLPTRAG